MVRKDNPLLDIGGIAKLLGVKRETVWQWRWREALPQPDEVVSGAPAWRLRTIEKWAADTGRSVAGLE